MAKGIFVGSMFRLRARGIVIVGTVIVGTVAAGTIIIAVVLVTGPGESVGGVVGCFCRCCSFLLLLALVLFCVSCL